MRLLLVLTYDLSRSNKIIHTCVKSGLFLLRMNTFSTLTFIVVTQLHDYFIPVTNLIQVVTQLHDYCTMLLILQLQDILYICIIISTV